MGVVIFYVYILPGVILALGYCGLAFLFKKQKRSITLGEALAAVAAVLAPFINIVGILVLVAYLIDMYEVEINKILSIKIL